MPVSRQRKIHEGSCRKVCNSDQITEPALLYIVYPLIGMKDVKERVLPFAPPVAR